jgi:ankyrin repeat protein
VSTVPLPEEPSLQQLRKQAKDLRRAVLAGDPEAVAEAAARYPEAVAEVAERHSGAPQQYPGGLPLRAAQLIVARRYGFASWARLKRHVEVVTRYSRFPERITADGAADTFLRLACLSYAGDEPARWDEARRILDHDAGIAEGRAAGIAEGNVHVAAATADAGELRRVLAADPAAARREGGPFGWEPLLYLAYARHDPEISEDATLEAGRLLLDASADPNAGYLWHGLPSPFTVLTGVFGEGELGPVRQPRHPHSLALGRLLLEAGADPNDGQALYNRMFESGNDHLELLFEFGLGTGDGGPWRRRLGDVLDSPAEMLRGQLAWAITHGMTERVRLLVEHGADVAAPFDGGATVTSMAATTGHPDLVDYLVAHGAPALDLALPDAFVAAALAADRARLDRLLIGHPGLAAQVRTSRPALVAWAAACGEPAAVELLVELGFDVNVRGRTDVPSDQPWQTALHKAAEDGNLELARTLLRLGADPDIRDERFDSTPLGWARYFGQQALIELLEPVTDTAE